MEKKNKKFDVTKFESLESKGEILKGGFSTAFTGGKDGLSVDLEVNGYKCGQTNNCSSGNCVAGCGSTSTTP